MSQKALAIVVGMMVLSLVCALSVLRFRHDLEVRWEHDIVVVRPGDNRSQEALDKAESEGWELIEVTNTTSRDITYDVLWFKRQRAITSASR